MKKQRIIYSSILVLLAHFTLQGAALRSSLHSLAQSLKDLSARIQNTKHYSAAGSEEKLIAEVSNKIKTLKEKLDKNTFIPVTLYFYLSSLYNNIAKLSDSDQKNSLIKELGGYYWIMQLFWGPETFREELKNNDEAIFDIYKDFLNPAELSQKYPSFLRVLEALRPEFNKPLVIPQPIKKPVGKVTSSHEHSVQKKVSAKSIKHDLNTVLNYYIEYKQQNNNSENTLYIHFLIYEPFRGLNLSTEELKAIVEIIEKFGSFNDEKSRGDLIDKIIDYLITIKKNEIYDDRLINFSASTTPSSNISADQFEKDFSKWIEEDNKKANDFTSTSDRIDAHINRIVAYIAENSKITLTQSQKDALGIVIKDPFTPEPLSLRVTNYLIKIDKLPQRKKVSSNASIPSIEILKTEVYNILYGLWRKNQLNSTSNIKDIITAMLTAVWKKYYLSSVIPTYEELSVTAKEENEIKNIGKLNQQALEDLSKELATRIYTFIQTHNV